MADKRRDLERIRDSYAGAVKAGSESSRMTEDIVKRLERQDFQSQAHLIALMLEASAQQHTAILRLNQTVGLMADYMAQYN